jgi:hypothetical protein
MVQVTTTPETTVREVVRPIIITRQRMGFVGATEKAAHEGGELPSLNEFVLWLSRDKANYNRAKRDWFWLREEPDSGLMGRCRIDHSKGTPEPVTSEEEWCLLDDDKRATVLSRDGQTCVAIGLTVFANVIPGQARVAYALKGPEAQSRTEEILRS